MHIQDVGGAPDASDFITTSSKNQWKPAIFETIMNYGRRFNLRSQFNKTQGDVDDLSKIFNNSKRNNDSQREKF